MSKICQLLQTEHFGWHSESGFTLLEVLVVSASIILLGGISVAGFHVHKANAEYSKGSATLHHMKTALVAGEVDHNDLELEFTFSSTVGGPLAGDMAVAMPGGIVSPYVRVGAELAVCDGTSGMFDRNAYLVVKPCAGDREIRWERFCSGIEVTLENVASPAGCV